MDVWKALIDPLINGQMKAKPLCGFLFFLLYLLQSHFVKKHELEEVQHNIVISIYEPMVGLHCVHPVLLAPQELSIPKPSREAALLSSASRFMKQ